MNEKEDVKGDPDYEIPESAKEQKRIRDELEKNQIVHKLKEIVKKEFHKELDFREKQLELIQKRINKTSKSLHLLRYCLVTSFYNRPELQVNNKDDKSFFIDEQSRIHPAVKKLLNSSSSNGYNNLGLRKKKHREKPTKEEVTETNISGISRIDDGSNINPEELVLKNEVEIKKSPENVLVRNRKLYKHKIVIGNISKWAPSDSSEDESTHKWMVYVRGPKDYPDISHIVEKVVFHLHPSYKPNDVIEISKSPFHLTRRGWGEFPLRIQLFFHGKLNKPVDIIHNLKLDRTYSGRQTLGNETVIELSLYELNKTKENNRTFEMDVEEFNYDVNNTIRQEQRSDVINVIDTSKINETTATMHPVETVNLINLDHTYCRHYNGEEFRSDEVVMMKKRKNPQSLLKSCITKRIKTEIIEDTTKSNTIDINRYKIDLNSYRLDNLDQALSVLFKKLPMITENALHLNYKSLYPFTASSVEEFSSWLAMKQFASEWSRARFIKKMLRTAKFTGCDILNTKDILNFGRIRGFTPRTKYKIFDTASKEDDCDYRTFKNILTRLPESNVPVNVTDCDLNNVKREEPINALLTWTDNFKYERSFVRKAAKEVSVKLEQDQIIPGVLYSTSERILFECVKSFAEDLIRQSISAGVKQGSFNENSILNPTHVVKGLHSRPEYEKILMFNRDF